MRSLQMLSALQMERLREGWPPCIPFSTKCPLGRSCGSAGPQVSTGPWCLVSLWFRTVGSYWVELRKEEALGWEAWSGVLGGAGSQQAWS